MAHVLSLTDGTQTINLAEATVAGYHFVSYAAPGPNRKLARVSGFPFVDGSRTVASSLDDVAAELVVNIVGTNADDLDARFQALIRLLQQAQRWEEKRTGTPVRLLMAPQGVTNTAYRVVTGVPVMPAPIDVDLTWIDMHAIATELTVQFTLTLAPVAHAPALTSILTATGLTNHTSLNRATTSATTGTMPGPLLLNVKKTSAGVPWTELHVAICPSVPQFGLGGGTPVGGTVSGFPWEKTTTSTTGEMIGLPYSINAATFNYPVRHIARLKVTAGDPAKVQMRYTYTLGFNSSGASPIVYGPWVQFGAALGVWVLSDIGVASNIMQPILNRSVTLTTGELQAIIQVRSLDGSSVTLQMDTIEWVPYLSYLKCSPASLPQNYAVVYESVRTSAGFVFPSDPVTYQITSGSVLDTLTVPRFGLLNPLIAGTTPVVWFAAQGASHDHLATADIRLWHLPTYALGLRGNA